MHCAEFLGCRLRSAACFAPPCGAQVCARAQASMLYTTTSRINQHVCSSHVVLHSVVPFGHVFFVRVSKQGVRLLSNDGAKKFATWKHNFDVPASTSIRLSRLVRSRVQLSVPAHCISHTSSPFSILSLNILPSMVPCTTMLFGGYKPELTMYPRPLQGMLH